MRPLLLLVAFVSCSSLVTSQTMLFNSGFESASVLGTQQAQSTDSWQYYSGIDSSTGSAWPMTFWTNSAAQTGHHFIRYTVPAGKTTQDLGNNSIVTMTGHGGNTTKALQMEIDDWNVANGCCTQDTLQVGGLSQTVGLAVRSFYLRYWMRLYDNAQTQMNSDLNNWFHSLFWIKTPDDFRIEAYFYGHHTNTGMFHVQADCNTGSSFCGSTGGGNSQGQYWSYDNTTVAIPFGQWFLVEFYVNRGTPTDASSAEFFWGVNGQSVFDIKGTSTCPGRSLANPIPTCFYGLSNQEASFTAFASLYAPATTTGTPFGQWVDDLEIWDSPPCGTLPCGSGSVPANTVFGTGVSGQLSLSGNVRIN